MEVIIVLSSWSSQRKSATNLDYRWMHFRNALSLFMVNFFIYFFCYFLCFAILSSMVYGRAFSRVVVMKMQKLVHSLWETVLGKGSLCVCVPALNIPTVLRFWPHWLLRHSPRCLGLGLPGWPVSHALWLSLPPQYWDCRDTTIPRFSCWFWGRIHSFIHLT